MTAMRKNTPWSVIKVQTSVFGGDERIEKRELDRAIEAGVL